MPDEMSPEEVAALKMGLKCWFQIILDSKQAQSNGVVRRSRASMLRHCTEADLQQFVYDHCFHLIETGDQFIIICNTDAFKVHC